MDAGDFTAQRLQAAQRRLCPGDDAACAWREDAVPVAAAHQLEASWHNYRLAHAAGGDMQARVDAALAAAGGPAALQGLDAPAAAAWLARLHGDLDHLHPFARGHREAVRAFLAELAAASGWRLDWAALQAQPLDRDRLCVASDREVVQRVFPGLHQGRAMTTTDKAEYEAYARFLAPFAQWPGLAALLKPALAPA